jgi:murein L,D-transpeptidase YcbB/YkuD
MPLVSRRFAGDPRLQAAAANSPALAYGAKGAAVSKMQSALVDLGFPMPITTAGGAKAADGIWGSETSATVRKFQGLNGLIADGVAGRDTLGRLDVLIRGWEEARRLQDAIGAKQHKATTNRID